MSFLTYINTTLFRPRYACWQLLKKAMESIEDVPDVLSTIISSLSSIKEETLVPQLTELEYLLSDVDIARDFYVLRGWGPLLSLLSHPSPSVRSLTLHCVGTALKNAEEFDGWPGLDAVVGAIETHGDLGKVIYAVGGMVRGSERRRGEFLGVLGGEEKLLKALEVRRPPLLRIRGKTYLF